MYFVFDGITALLSFILFGFCAEPDDGWGLAPELLPPGGRTTAANASSSSPFSKSIRSLYTGLFSISFAIRSASDSWCLKSSVSFFVICTVYPVND